MAQRRDIMLAYKMTEAKFNKLPKPVIVQPKLNGNRCRAIFDDDGNVKLLSSSGLPIVSVDHIVKQLKLLPVRNLELDGELYRHGWSHQKINGIVRRTITTESSHSEITYNIFDTVDENMMQANRILIVKQIDGFILSQRLTHVKTLKSYFAETLDQVMFWLAKFMDEGYEGIIIRNGVAKYTRKRTNNLLKLKPMKFDTFEIIGYKKELTKVCIICKQTPSRCQCTVKVALEDLVEIPLDTLGAIECKTFDGKTFYVGSGKALTDSTRYNLWESRQTIVGKRALVKFQGLSDDGIPVHGVLEEIK